MILKELKNVLEYNYIDGVFIWKRDIYRGKGKGNKLVNKGDIAGFIAHDGYRYIKYNGKRYLEHRLAFLFIYNESPEFIDHIDGNKSNNRINNLRKCDRNQNGQNRGKMANNTSGYKGVHLDKRNNKYASQIRNNGRLEWLGYFDNVEDAAKAYDKRALEIFGEFALLNSKLDLDKFGNSNSAAPFPSAVVIFNNSNNVPKIAYMNNKPELIGQPIDRSLTPIIRKK
jgi:hypothetical protein